MSKSFHSPKLEEYFKQFELEDCISFLRKIFRFSYTKTRGDDGAYIWFGDRDWDMKSQCPLIHIGYCSIYFIDYTEEQVIEKYDKYHKLKAFL
jgi:hypothetical protein